jgi:hypothetical protein
MTHSERNGLQATLMALDLAIGLLAFYAVV